MSRKLLRRISSAFLATCLLMLNAHAQNWISTDGPWRTDVRNLTAGRLTPSTQITLYTSDVSTIYKSANSAGSWSATTSPGGNPLAITCKPDDPQVVVAGLNGLVKRSTNSGDAWTIRIQDSNVHPLRLATSPANSDNMYLGMEKVAGQSSMQRSSDGGVNWQTVTYFFGGVQTYLTALAPHPTDASKVWAGGTTPPSLEPTQNFQYTYNNGIFFSTDAGATWSNSGDLAKNVVALAAFTFSSTTYIFAGTTDGSNKLYKTTNNGANWSSVTGYTGGLIKAITTRNDVTHQTIFVAADNGLYSSTDNGANWSVSCTGMYDANLNRVVAMVEGSPSNAPLVFTGGGATIYKSTNSGSSWSDVAYGVTKMSTSAAAINGSNALALSPDYAMVGRNIGSGWSVAQGLGSDCTREFRGIMVGFKTTKGATAFAAGYKTYASMWRSTDQGASWSELTSIAGTVAGAYNGFATDPVDTQRVFAFGKRTSSENIIVSNDGGSNWESVSLSVGAEVSDFVIDPSNPSSYSLKLYAAVYSGASNEKGIWKSTTGGSSWSRLTNSLVEGQPVRALGLNPNAPSVLYAAGGSTGSWWLRKSTNGGTDWSTISTMTSEVIDIQMHPSFPTSTNYLWVISNGGTTIHKTTDGGASSWTDITGGITSGATISSLSADLLNKGSVYAATSAGVFKRDETPFTPASFASSLSGGHPHLTWTANTEADVTSYDVTSYFQHCQFYCPNKVCGAGFGQVTYNTTNNYYDDNSITAWVCPAEGQGSPQIVTYYVQAVENGGIRSANTSTVTYRMDGGDPFKIGIPQDEVHQSSFLAANYPNPFNPVTTISYGLSEDAHVKITIIDVLGREVKVLVNERQKAGYFSTKFDGSQFASGVYLYKLTAGSFTEVKKMVVAK